MWMCASYITLRVLVARVERLPPARRVLGVRRGPLRRVRRRERIRGDRRLHREALLRGPLHASLVHAIQAELHEVVPHLVRGDDRDARLAHLLRDVRHRVQERRVRDDPEVLIFVRLAVESAAFAEDLGEVLVVLVVQHEVRVREAEVVLLGRGRGRGVLGRGLHRRGRLHARSEGNDGSPLLRGRDLALRRGRGDFRGRGRRGHDESGHDSRDDVR
mmetsp:Transcript_14543/g.34590  ORF Transcript_14543/g.34590 Transcript_14543/m.34590 type:complete len:217 (-) Transcript_14543:15-665(-)